MMRAFRGIEVLAICAACLMAILVLFNVVSRESWLPLAVVFVTIQVIWIFAQDIAHFTIPDEAVVAMAATGVVVRFAFAKDLWQSELMSLLLEASLSGFAFLAVREAFFRSKGFDGMGFGDVKLAVASCILIGMERFAWSVFAASALGLAIALGASLIGLERKIDRLPFGALLAPVCWAIWVMQLWSVA